MFALKFSKYLDSSRTNHSLQIKTFTYKNKEKKNSSKFHLRKQEKEILQKSSPFNMHFCFFFLFSKEKYLSNQQEIFQIFYVNLFDSPKQIETDVEYSSTNKNWYFIVSGMNPNRCQRGKPFFQMNMEIEKKIVTEK